MWGKGYLDLNFHEGPQEVFSEYPTCLPVDTIWYKHDRSYYNWWENLQKWTEKQKDAGINC